jgi:hypothetical protein
MSYQMVLEDKKSSEAISLFLAIRTKNIFEVDHLANKGFMPAILKRLEFAATTNDSQKIDDLKNKGLKLLESKEDQLLFMEDFENILDKNLPSIAKKKVLKI